MASTRIWKLSLPEWIRVLKSPNGTFTSPNYPIRYGNNNNCSWLITTDISTAVVRLFIDRFVTDLNHDFLYVYDGPTTSSPLLVVATGFYYSGLAPIVSSSTEMLVVFSSDKTITFSGFSAHYSVMNWYISNVYAIANSLVFLCSLFQVCVSWRRSSYFPFLIFFF